MLQASPTASSRTAFYPVNRQGGLGRLLPRPFTARTPHCSHPLPSSSTTSSASTTPTTITIPTHSTLHNPSSSTLLSRRNLLFLSLLSTPTSLLLPPPAPASAATASSSSSLDPGDWSSPGLGAPVDPAQPRFVRLPSGVRYQELNTAAVTPGSNGGSTAPAAAAAAGPGDTVLFDYVLRRSNGYFIYGTVEGVSFQPLDVPVGPVSARLGSGELIQGLEQVLQGMAPGCKRRALIPPELGYVAGGEGPQPPTFATRRQLESHRREPLLFEVQMLRVGGRK
ncbi:hypothetical protein Agub_g11667 [Astrephomene gubernaculifera]|uniref:peptidylprolyl isomerase n=1 Tax=Astrephomene gubernaculifera TaxID=47775 RepID=A0AAD3DZP2_9CHLO|nr:hypothetical protein Agub_g11667 [Astrephomene gubernaculifera]